MDSWFIGLLLIFIELGRSVPEFLRVVKHSSSDGLSPESLGVLAGTGVGWVILPAMLEAWWIFAANALWLVFHIALCIAVSRVSPNKRLRLFATIVLCLVGLVVATVFLSEVMSTINAIGLLLGLATLLYSVPALIEGLKSATTRGISVIALSVNSVEGMIYTIIGIGIVQMGSTQNPILGYIFFGLISLGSNLPRLVRVLWRRSKSLD